MTDVATTQGVQSNASYRSKHDAAVVERLRRAGAIILGKTNIPVNMLDWQS